MSPSPKHWRDQHSYDKHSLMHRYFRLAAFLLGIPLVLVGFVIARQDVHSRRNQNVFADQTTIDVIFPYENHSNGAASTALIFVTAPQRMRVGQSASVSIEVRTAQTRRPSFRLSASGLEVEPNDWIPLHAVREFDLVALWTIRATSPGSYSLVLNAKIEQESNNAETLVVRFFPSDNLTVSIVRGWDDYLKMVSGPFVTFMGSLLTLPGVIAFLKDRKRERGEQKAALQPAGKQRS
jgi:hypothetical protein